MDLISVIIPVYNTADYLDKCIKSIVSQTYKKIEIILVNDGSSDNSKEICENWLKVDNRIQLINKRNGGLSSARNEGIDIAKGDYIIFVDSDDYAEIEMIERLYDAIKKYKTDIVACNYRNVNTEYKIISRGGVANLHLEYYKKYAGLNYLQDIIEQKIPPMAWAKIYSTKFISDKRFKLNSKCEDTMFLYEHFNENNTALCIPDVLYNYLMREGSITYKFDEKTFLDRIEVAKYIEEKANSKFYYLKECARTSKYLALIRFITNMPYSYVKENNKSYIIVISEIKENLINIMKSKLHIKFKIYILLFIISPKILNSIANLLNKNAT